MRYVVLSLHVIFLNSSMNMMASIAQLASNPEGDSRFIMQNMYETHM